MSSAHKRSVAALVLLVSAAACAPTPGPAAHLTMADIQPIITPLTYRELLGVKCGVPNTAVKSAFLKELEAADAPADLLTQARAEATRIEAGDRETPNEYVCTAELFDSTEKNAADAQKAWTDLKNHKS